ncbi:MAG: ribosome assembly cofactor RimP [Mariprofundaceae bacterium]
MSKEAKILQLVQPIADELSVEVLKVSFGHGGRLLQVFVDCKGGVIADNLARISRGLALQLDVEDLIEGKYHLEVTTPGFDWPMVTQADFDRYLGDWIRVVRENPPAIEGENLGLEGGLFRLRDVKGEIHQFAQEDVVKVIRAVNWKEVSKAGKGK